jgi:hypothetical protein
MPSRRCPICSCSCRVGGPDTSRFVSGCRRHKGRAFGSLWALLLSFRDPDGACEQPTARGQSSQDQPAREPRRAAHEASAARQSGQRQRRTTPLRRRRSHSANRHGHMPPDRTRWPLRSTGPHRTSAAHRRAHVRTFARTREPEGGGSIQSSRLWPTATADHTNSTSRSARAQKRKHPGHTLLSACKPTP